MSDLIVIRLTTPAPCQHYYENFEGWCWELSYTAYESDGHDTRTVYCAVHAAMRHLPDGKEGDEG